MKRFKWSNKIKKEKRFTEYTKIMVIKDSFRAIKLQERKDSKKVIKL